MSPRSVETRPRVPVSIICVYNDPRVLSECLSPSVEAGLFEAEGSEYLPMDNTTQRFSSAGAALNYGASLARNDVVVFVHQDVYLHSIPALEKAAAALMQDESLGMAGATGVTRDGRLLGLIRDRTFLSGEHEPALAEVDSLDEVLFMARKEQVRLYPISQEIDLSWHAYAVEYGARLRTLGKRVVVADIPLTHNSLTINLHRLAEAHQHIAVAYPDQLPIMTTCGTVKRPVRVIKALRAPFGAHKWRYRWLRESLAAYRLRKNSSLRLPTVLGDLRRDIDEICASAGVIEASVISVYPNHGGSRRMGGPLELPRRNVRFSFFTADEATLAGLVAAHHPGSTVAITNVNGATIRSAVQALQGRRVLLGFHQTTGAWILAGPGVEAASAYYRNPRSIPLAMKLA
ncbi:Glycosyltransferase like family protein [Pseudarthrobacter equi]|uniref:Glycosyltransferase like family protein n=1 Tax=Pseudarthrobacter equi TaxID=728066 RepID=A0A1H1SX22_9MICC|nr:glycosyltransferase [Pseudarthrobacter equi]SDS52532.1 Glycosyltransferase like family protein [Pseudarthrobacter equi]